MFKSKEELIKEYIEASKKYPYANNFEQYYDAGIRDGINYAFNYFSERIEFYKKYKNMLPSELIQIDIWKKYSKKRMGLFNDWLFDFCFGEFGVEK